MLRWVVLALAASGLGCELSPGSSQPKSPGDNFYRLLINGEVERYAPGQRYVVTLVGSRTHDVVQQFTKFKLSAEPLDPASPRSMSKQGQFQLFADTLSKFDEECVNAVVEADDLPKTEIQVMWKAPAAGSGCVVLKAMVQEASGRWFAEDGQLSRRVCEDTTLERGQCCACDDAKYSLIFEGLWSAKTHPKDFPVAAVWLTHFSDVIGATHPKNFSFWGEGQIATDGFRSLAEWGSVGLLESELRQQGKLLRSIVKAPGLWHPRVNSNTSAAFTVDRKRHLLSLASMFGPSPDWVVGVSGLDLCQKDCTWVEDKVIDLYPYDAGTDNGISYMSPNQETVPREKMYRITTMYPEDPRAPFYDPSRSEIPPMARLYLKRERLISRGCDEETLQAMVAEEVESSQTVDAPECAVTEWGPWSPCSVSCGKGLRMRTRNYRAPATAVRCTRQLVSKEMCVADVPECPTDTSNDADLEPAPVDLGGVCEVSPWSAWSECSVSCGVGRQVRTRHFIDRMGAKKCPLVNTEETRKCMEPPCPEGSDDNGVAVPGCPASEWSAWSPCSASCGKGVRFRTRLLLVPADQQAECSTKVELLQQRPCKEQDDCTIDMMTAKKICMEEPVQGPCRGLYQRWAFVAMKGMCIPFSYGGCRGNRNNFLTQEDCMDTCRVVLGGAAAAAPQTNQLPTASSSNLATLQTGLNSSDSTQDCVLSSWSEWTRCSVTCGVGYQERTRTLLRQAGPGGAPCPVRMSRRRRCSRPCY